MKEIDISKLSSYSKFVTRTGKEVSLIKYVPQAHDKSKLLFILEGNVLGCDEKGKCWTVNSYDSFYTETSYLNFDVFAEDVIVGYINIFELNGSWFVQEGRIHRNLEEAIQKKQKGSKIIKIDWTNDEVNDE